MMAILVRTTAPASIHQTTIIIAVEIEAVAAITIIQRAAVHHYNSQHTTDNRELMFRNFTCVCVCVFVD